MSLQSLEQNLGFFKQLHFLNVKRCFSVQAVRCCTVVSPSWDFFSIILLRTQTSEPKHEELLSTAVPHMGLQEEKNILCFIAGEKVWWTCSVVSQEADLAPSTLRWVPQVSLQPLYNAAAPSLLLQLLAGKAPTPIPLNLPPVFQSMSVWPSAPHTGCNFEPRAPQHREVKVRSGTKKIRWLHRKCQKKIYSSEQRCMQSC